MQQLISRYNRLGLAAVETPGKGGRRRAYLTIEQERHFLEPFLTRAQTGELVTVAELHRAFETHVGHEVDDSMIYRLLHRHGWRKLVPRPRHPKAEEEAQESFKKNFPTRCAPSWQPERLMITDHC